VQVKTPQDKKVLYVWKSEVGLRLLVEEHDEGRE